MANVSKVLKSFTKSNRKKGFSAKASDHPLIVSGAMLAGAGLAYAAYKAVNAERSDVAKDVHIETSIAIDKTPQELFAFWRDFRNLALFMKNIISVTPMGGNRSHWVARGIADSKVEWDAEIYNEIENELIAWRSLENSDVVHAGTVRFRPGPSGRGTFVRVTINYNPPVGKVGHALASLVGFSPDQLIKEDLRRLKQLTEAGEFVTVEGQSSGRAEAEREKTTQTSATAARAT